MYKSSARVKNSLKSGGRTENPIRKTTTKGGNYRSTKSGAGMTAKGVRAYRSANPGSKLKQP